MNGNHEEYSSKLDCSSWSNDSGHCDDFHQINSSEKTSDDCWTTVLTKKEKQRQGWRKKAVELALNGALVPPFDPSNSLKKSSTNAPTPKITKKTPVIIEPTSSPHSRPRVSPSPSWLAVHAPIVDQNRNLEVRLQGVMFGDLVPIPTNPRIDPPAHVCFNCWKPGHTRRYCPKPEDPNLCFNCGRRGVTMNECPRCSKQRVEHLKKLRQQRAGQSDDHVEGKIRDLMQQPNLSRWLLDANLRVEREIDDVRDKRDNVGDENEIFLDESFEFTEDDDNDFVELLKRSRAMNGIQ